MINVGKFVFIAATLFLNINVAAAGTVQVKTIDGKEVSVASDEVRRAFYLTFDGRLQTNAERFVINDDKSVTIYNPFFRYEGENLPFGSLNTVGFEGICVFFGLNKDLAISAAGTATRYVHLWQDGTYSAIGTHPSERVIVKIHCRPY